MIRDTTIPAVIVRTVRTLDPSFGANRNVEAT